MAAMQSQKVGNFSTHVLASDFQLVDEIGPQVDSLCSLGLHPPCEHLDETRWLPIDVQLQLHCNFATCRPVAEGLLQLFGLFEPETRGIPLGDFVGHNFRQLVAVPLRAPGHGKCEQANVKVKQFPP